MTDPGNAREMSVADTQDAALTAFAGRVAHDFNNLLTGILGNLELLGLRAARHNVAGLESYLEGASSAGARAADFAARLALYAGRGTAPPARVAVDPLLGKFSGPATCRLGAGDAALLCDAAELELLVTELLANAEAAGGKATITSSVTARDIIITVSDDGQGMSAEILGQACQPFFSTARSGTGRGLGLPIAARVVHGLGGQMALAARPGAGCTVTLTLPRV